MTGTNTKTLLFELSGEHPELPGVELEAVLNNQLNVTLDNNIEIESPSTRMVIVKLNKDQYYESLPSDLGHRLAFCRSINELLSHGDPRFLLTEMDGFNLDQLPQASSFKLITRRIPKTASGNSKNSIQAQWTKDILDEVKDYIIRKFAQRTKVNVKNPELELVLYISSELFLTRKLFEVPRSEFETRKPQSRPYFSPVSLHPRLARGLVNLAGIRPGDILLDPFCGTGGVLLEAGLMGMRLIGSDVDSRMVQGTRTNLEHFGIDKFDLIEADISDLPSKLSDALSNKSRTHSHDTQVAAIVTEPPYGRASTTAGKELMALMECTYLACSKILTHGQRLVISLPEANLVEPAYKYFELSNKFTIPIHRSLTKSVFVLKLKNVTD
jgi:tRNA (guanine10-N2)-dimethyltransferase